MVIIFGFFRELSYLQDQDQQDYKKTFYEKYPQLRLNDVLSNIANENEKTLKLPFTFHSDPKRNESVIFIYDNGVHLNPEFSSLVIGRLYFEPVKTDKKNNIYQLCLGTWPLYLQNQAAEHFYKEILVTDIESYQLEFFAPSEEHLYVEDGAKPIGKGWLKKWEKDYKSMPVMFKIILKKVGEEEKKSYLFALPTSKYAVKFNS